MTPRSELPPGIGIADGHWFSIRNLPGGQIDYEFFKGDKLAEKGVCSEEEMWERWDKFSGWSNKNGR